MEKNLQNIKVERRGGYRPGGGRPKGSANKERAFKAVKAAEAGLTPLAYMLAVLRNEQAPDKDRAWAAEKAAPYCHPRLNATEHSGSVGIRQEDALAELE